jgi:hypothetical protein
MDAATIDFDIAMVGLLIECGGEPRRFSRRLSYTGKQDLNLRLRNSGRSADVPL